jgi:hypothetical protein
VLGFLGGRADAPKSVIGLSVSLLPPSFIIGKPGGVQGPYSELLGYWVIPIALLAAAAFAIGGTYIVRRAMQRNASRLESHLTGS